MKAFNDVLFWAFVLTSGTAEEKSPDVEQNQNNDQYN